MALTAGVMTVEDVAFEVDAEGSAAAVAAMDRTGAAALRPGPLQPGRQAQVIEDARHGQLRLEVGEVEPDAGPLTPSFGRAGGGQIDAGHGDL